MLQGTINRVDPDGKFGFLTGQNGEEYFFHQSALKGTNFGDLAPGVDVEFNVSEDAGDMSTEQRRAVDMSTEHLRAVDIRLAPDAIPADDNEPLPPEKVE